MGEKVQPAEPFMAQQARQHRGVFATEMEAHPWFSLIGIDAGVERGNRGFSNVEMVAIKTK